MERCEICHKFGTYERASELPEKIIKVFKSKDNTLHTYHVKCYSTWKIYEKFKQIKL